MTLIFDIAISGHHLEYLLHLMSYVLTLPENKRKQYLFIVHPDFKEKLAEKLNNRVNFNTIQIIPVKDSEIFFLKTEKQKLTLSDIVRIIKLLKKYITIYNPDKCLILTFDNIFKGLIFSPIKIKISGIWFNPYPRLPESNAISLVKKLLKRISLSLIIRLNFLEKIFILNDKRTVKELNDTHKTNLFTFLPDPVNIVHNSISKQIINKSEKVSFLLFGSISKRKGALLLLEAITLMDDFTLQNSRFLIIGKVVKPFKELFYAELKKTKKKKPKADILLVDRFVVDNEVNKFFSACNYILLPYLNFYGSSGIVGYAAYYKKPVIANKVGLLFDLVNDYNLGCTINASPELLAKEIRLCTEDKNYLLVNEKGCTKYIKAHQIELFAKKLLNE